MPWAGHRVHVATSHSGNRFPSLAFFKAQGLENSLHTSLLCKAGIAQKPERNKGLLRLKSFVFLNNQPTSSLSPSRDLLSQFSLLSWVSTTAHGCTTPCPPILVVQARIMTSTWEKKPSIHPVQDVPISVL